jgi:hypothetical protein
MKGLGRFREVYERVGMELIPEEIVIAKYGSDPYHDADGNTFFTQELINAQASFHGALITLLKTLKKTEEANYEDPVICDVCGQREVEEYKDSGICDTCDNI